jgi:hypothetical protein
MKLKKIAKKIAALLLLGVFFYATSVKDFHYAFDSAAKYHSVAYSDNCDHHIHSTHQEDDCLICKLEVAALFPITAPAYSFSVVFLSLPAISQPAQALLASQVHALYLRGPPSAA